MVTPDSQIIGHPGRVIARVRVVPGPPGEVISETPGPGPDLQVANGPERPLGSLGRVPDWHPGPPARPVIAHPGRATLGHHLKMSHYTSDRTPGTPGAALAYSRPIAFSSPIAASMSATAVAGANSARFMPGQRALTWEDTGGGS
jgi:hypothetical protein